MKLNGNLLLAAMKRCGQYTGSELVNLRAAKQKLLLSASNEGSTYAELLDIEDNDSWRMSVRPNDVAKLLKGVVTFNLEKNQAVVKTSTYRGAFPTEPYAAPEFPDIKATVLSASTAEAFYASVRDTGITAVMDPVLYEFRISKKGFQAATWDRLHFVYWTGKYSGPEMSARLSWGDISTLTQAVQPDSNGVSLAVDDNSLFAKNSSVKLFRPGMQQDSANGLVELEAFSTKFHSPACSVSPNDLYGALGRSLTVCEDDTAANISIGKGRMKVTVESGKGKFEEVVSATVASAASFLVDPKLLLDLLARVPETESVHLGVTNSFVWMQVQKKDCSIHYACLTSQPAENG